MSVGRLINAAVAVKAVAIARAHPFECGLPFFVIRVGQFREPVCALLLMVVDHFFLSSIIASAILYAASE